MVEESQQNNWLGWAQAQLPMVQGGGCKMPEYRSGSVKGGSQFAGVGRFLNLKRVFDDAVRQERWTKERDVLHV